MIYMVTTVHFAYNITLFKVYLNGRDSIDYHCSAIIDYPCQDELLTRRVIGFLNVRDHFLPFVSGFSLKNSQFTYILLRR